MSTRTTATSVITVAAAITTTPTTARWAAGAAATLTKGTATLVSALSVPLLTSERKFFIRSLYMKAVYIKENDKLDYFIFGMNEVNDEIDSEEYRFENIEIIKNKAFQSPWNVKRVFFDEKLKTIEKEAFKDCSELEVFCCGKFCDQQKEKIVNLKVNELIIELESKPNQAAKTDNNKNNAGNQTAVVLKKYDFNVQTAAFSGCKSLHTVVFPKCSKLIIEKSSFENCSSLRTIVAFADKISFTENPFEECPKELTFVCSKDSEIERFARENGYGIIYA